ncbi:MAG TPA: hypothetical protein VMW46_01450 [Candidatus Desulfaltia sp.]|nr:hypothetical protein [Candidatus Desulfaltia sp.]
MGELKRHYDDPTYRAVRRDLTAELLRLQGFYGDSEELARKFIQNDRKE